MVKYEILESPYIEVLGHPVAGIIVTGEISGDRLWVTGDEISAAMSSLGRDCFFYEGERYWFKSFKEVK